MYYKLFTTIFLLLGLMFFSSCSLSSSPLTNKNPAPVPVPDTQKKENPLPPAPPLPDTPVEAPPKALNLPLDQALKRITKKPFGIYITPETSPIENEKFRGYHTGTDFEILDKELNQEIAVKAICSGKLKAKQRIDGYGGIIIQDCILNGQNVTVLYGHLALSNVTKNTGDELTPGEVIAFLGKDKSTDTDGERQHLHLGIHKGSGVNYRGYVASQNDLNNWLDFEKEFIE